jgi:hypothetical protein
MDCKSKNIKLYFLFILTFGGIPAMHAQEDIGYDHILSVATYYNPSFAGTNGKYSLAHNFTTGDLQPTKSKFQSFNFSFDTYINAIHGGIGVLGYFNQVTPQFGSSRYFGLIYAPKFYLWEKFLISPSVKFGYLRNMHELTVMESDYSYDTISVIKGSADWSAGILLSTANMYAGFATDHIFQPEIKFQSNTLMYVHRKYVAQWGYHYSRSDASSSFLHLNILYQNQFNNNFIFGSDYFIGSKIRSSLMGEDLSYRLLFGLGYKFALDPLSENCLFIGVGAQDKALTLGIGMELSTFTYNVKTIETSIKYTFGAK